MISLVIWFCANKYKRNRSTSICYKFWKPSFKIFEIRSPYSKNQSAFWQNNFRTLLMKYFISFNIQVSLSCCVHQFHFLYLCVNRNVKLSSYLKAICDCQLWIEIELKSSVNIYFYNIGGTLLNRYIINSHNTH